MTELKNLSKKKTKKNLALHFSRNDEKIGPALPSNFRKYIKEHPFLKMKYISCH